MSNGTQDNSKATRDWLRDTVVSYRCLLLADERRLLEAMLAFERSCRAESMHRVA